MLTLIRTTSLTFAVAAAAALGAAAPAGASTAGTSTTHASSSSARSTGGSAVCKAVDEGRVDGLDRPGRATVVLASDYGTSHATLTECVRSGDDYVVDYSVDARIGREGFAPSGAKREGDGRSPSGVYSFGHGFGGGDPGSTTGYREITDRSCWVDEPGSTYNTWQETDNCRGEQLGDYVSREYAQGIVINYNTDEPVAGKGSAIFLHASGDGSTAGCVSVAEETVTEKMRHTRSGDRIVMGVADDVISDESGSGSGDGSPTTQTLRPGSSDRAAVTALQREIGVSADGIYGPRTTAAVETVQGREGLTVDGIAGPDTLGALGLR